MKRIVLVLLALLAMQIGDAHCDTTQGPVIKDAQKALDTGNVNYVLKWVMPEHEDRIEQAFERARATGDEMSFFEELVKVHREGEGAQYTGVKEDAELEPVVVAADAAVETGSLGVLHPYVSADIHDEVVEKFDVLMDRKDFRVDDVKAGREYVAAYVDFVHFVESGGSGHAHAHEAENSEDALTGDAQDTEQSGLTLLGWTAGGLAALSALGVVIMRKR